MQSGRDQFRAWMKRRTMNQAEAAKFFGWHESVISQYLSGDRVPATVNAVKIEEATGIPVRAWLLSQSAKAPRRPARPTRKPKSSQGDNRHVD